MNDPDGPTDPQPQGERDDRPELDIDSAFAAIVANFSAPVPHGVGPWPASEDLDDDEPDDDGPVPDGDRGDDGLDGGGRRGAHGAPSVPGGTRAPDGPGADVPPPPDPWSPPARRISLPGESRAEEIGGFRSTADDADDEEGYQPPEPPPLPRGDLVSRLAWAGVVGGPLFLLVAALAWRSLPTLLLLLALAAFVGGFVVLVARMPPEHPDDPDDGAVV